MIDDRNKGLDDPSLFNELPEEEKQRLLNWINENVKIELKGPNDPMILKSNNKLDLVLPVRLREW